MTAPEHELREVPALDDLTSLAHPEPLDRYRSQVLALTRSGLDAGVAATEVSEWVADANDTLVRRVLVLAEADIGAAPRPYRWLSLGSHGRREQVLSSDQDHAIAYAPGPAHEAQAVQDHFTALAHRVVTALTRAGLPPCTGGYMATTWCRPLEEYERMFRGWVDNPQPQALLQAEVFLDTRACHGTLDTDRLDRILRGGGARGPFRAQLARAAVTFRPPLTWLGRLRTTRSPGGGPDGIVDVKLGGTAAIVLLARLYALAAGSSEHSTLPRLQAAAAGGSLGPSTAETLVDAYRFLTDLRLRHQLAQREAGVPADNAVPLDRLTREERARLRTTLRAVRDIQDVTAMRFATSMVT